MDLLQQFRAHIKANDLFLPKDKLLLAVSGGVDSVVLCELCKQAGYDFVIAHCNFQLRGAESDRDEEFVKKLGAKYEVEVKVKRFETENYAAENKLSTQEAARDLRYSWFKELLAPDSRLPTPDFLLTAHHADDNIETVMMNFFRGTGPQGLAGIPEKINNTRRPLLPFWKDQLIKFARENKLEYVEDSSNDSSKYTRNYFRNELIKGIEKVYPGVKENLLDNIKRFKEIGSLYESMVTELIRKLGRKKGNEFHIPVKQLAAYNNRALIYAIITPYSFSGQQIDEVVKLLESESGKYTSSSTHRIIRNRAWLIITPLVEAQSENILIGEGCDNIQFAVGNLQLTKPEISNIKLSTSSKEACLDLSAIKFPLLLRKWKQGDYFYPLGMKKKKKLARFFIDQKLSKTEKEKVWVIESNKRIVWVIGHRIDERFKVTDRTKKTLHLSLHS